MKSGTSSTRSLAAGAAALVAGALGLSACHPPHIHRSARQDWNGRAMSVDALLTCPISVGGLTRTAQAGDGQACDYVGRRGEVVHLSRLVLGGRSPQDALAPTEAALRPLIPPRGGPTPVSVDDQTSDHAKVDLPGVHVNAQGDRAEVRVFGITVDADGRNADVNLGQGGSRTVVQAGPNGAEVRAESIDAANASLFLFLAADRAGPSGLHAVGYLARGPVAGPLVVASFKSAAGHQDWRSDHDLNRLLELNVHP
jgi:hypothetical protein